MHPLTDKERPIASRFLEGPGGIRAPRVISTLVALSFVCLMALPALSAEKAVSAVRSCPFGSLIV